MARIYSADNEGCASIGARVRYDLPRGMPYQVWMPNMHISVAKGLGTVGAWCGSFGPGGSIVIIHLGAA